MNIINNPLFHWDLWHWYVDLVTRERSSSVFSSEQIALVVTAMGISLVTSLLIIVLMMFRMSRKILDRALFIRELAITTILGISLYTYYSQWSRPFWVSTLVYSIFGLASAFVTFSIIKENSGD